MVFWALNVSGQIEVKEGSFKQIDGYVMLDKNEHIDMNNAPMALIKISTENISNEDRRKFVFRGNLATYFDVHYEIGEIYLYVTASSATFIEIIHENFGKTEFLLPYKLCDYCGYEIVVTRVMSVSNIIAISSEPAECNIYIDGVVMGTTPKIFSNLSVGVHELRLEKEGYSPLKKEFEINNDDRIVLNMMLQKVKSVRIMTNQRGDEIYVGDVYVGLSPVTIDLPMGVHTFIAKREDMNEKKTIEIVDDGEDCIVRFNFDNISFNVNGVDFCMVKVIGGTFEMGATLEQGSDACDYEKPIHSVTLSDYYIGETEVTQKLWEVVMGNNPSKYKNDQNPVECVSWYDCQEFIKKLNVITGENFRLPTESEWEYAARGGCLSEGYKYAGSDIVDEVAWHRYNSEKRQHSEVKGLNPNELGLYDMSGNVCEWCQDCFLPYNYLRDEASINNEMKDDNYKYTIYQDQIFFVHGNDFDKKNGDLISSYARVLRGGCWDYLSTYCRVSYRFNRNPKDSYNYSGLRLAL